MSCRVQPCHYRKCSRCRSNELVRSWSQPCSLVNWYISKLKAVIENSRIICLTDKSTGSQHIEIIRINLCIQRCVTDVVWFSVHDLQPVPCMYYLFQLLALSDFTCRRHWIVNETCTHESDTMHKHVSRHVGANALSMHADTGWLTSFLLHAFYWWYQKVHTVCPFALPWSSRDLVTLAMCKTGWNSPLHAHDLLSNFYGHLETSITFRLSFGIQAHSIGLLASFIPCLVGSPTTACSNVF